MVFGIRVATSLTRVDTLKIRFTVQPDLFISPPVHLPCMYLVYELQCYVCLLLFALNLKASNVRGKVNEVRKGRQPEVESTALCYRQTSCLHYLGAPHIIIFHVYVITVVIITY
jgi:hypothetical protein